MKAIDYNYACERSILKSVIETWLRESKLPWATRNKILTDWRNQRCLLNIRTPLYIRRSVPIDRYHHNLAFTQKYLEKVLFKL